MSTYLVALFVSDFAFMDGRSLVRPTYTDSGEVTNVTTEVRIWARSESIDQADLAARVTPDMLEFLEDYFQIVFPLPKIDLLALPDFGSGAMENWGLVTFR